MIRRPTSRPGNTKVLGAILVMAICALALPGIRASAGAEPAARLSQGAPAVTSTPTPTPVPLCGLAWRVVSSPDGSQDRNYLQAIAAVSSNDIWAVGNYSDQAATNTLVEHWDGSAWSLVHSPNPAATNELNAISILGANDIWAVGTVTIHWDGTSWTSFPTPESVNLRGVSAISPNDVWAVGNTILHWDGSGWSTVPGAAVGELYGAVAVSSTDVWAVGTYWNGSVVATLVERWDGAQWQQVPSPNGQGFASQLSGVTALAANNVWAVGYTNTGEGLTTLVEHWDGNQWTIVPSPNNDSSGLNAIAARTSSDIWAVGNAEVTGGTYPPVLEHWDGANWSLVPADNPTDFNSQAGVTYGGADDVWVAGYRLAQQDQRTWIMRYNDPCSTTTPSPTGSPTITSTSTPSAAIPSATPTAAATGTPTPSTTATQTRVSSATPAHTPGVITETSTTVPTPTPTSTSTAVSTPTACTMQFIDVQEGSTFYPYIHRLACAGIVSGYGDGTFRPNNNVRRGQAAKIVSNSAGYSDNIPSARQTFEDVMPGSAFWLYIERVVVHGVINGYPCGQAPAGACMPPGNRPYFLPDNNLTRGQLAKIDANAANYNEIIPSTQQTFEDAAPDSPFWLYIERVYLHGVISGYQCSQPPAGPCMPPGNRPYFLPDNNVTRGQTSKIVSNTYFQARNKK